MVKCVICVYYLLTMYISVNTLICIHKCVCVHQISLYLCIYLQTHEPSSLPSKQHALLSDTHQDVRGLSPTSFIFRAVFLGRHELLLDLLLQIFLFLGQHFLRFPKSLDRVLGCRLFSALFPTAEQLHQHRHFGINADNYLKKSPGIFLGSKKKKSSNCFSQRRHW